MAASAGTLFGVVSALAAMAVEGIGACADATPAGNVENASKTADRSGAIFKFISAYLRTRSPTEPLGRTFSQEKARCMHRA